MGGYCSYACQGTASGRQQATQEQNACTQTKTAGNKRYQIPGYNKIAKKTVSLHPRHCTITTAVRSPCRNLLRVTTFVCSPDTTWPTVRLPRESPPFFGIGNCPCCAMMPAWLAGPLKKTVLSNIRYYHGFFPLPFSLHSMPSSISCCFIWGLWIPI